MTIGVGFLCGDGVVLAADTQMTASGYFKDYEHKIFNCHHAGATAIFTYAGNDSLVKIFVAKFAEALKLVPQPITLQKLHDAVETVLSLIDALDTDKTGLDMLCGLASQGEVALLKSEGKTVSPVNQFAYVGGGDTSVLRYVNFMTNKVPAHTLRQAYLLGVYMVYEAKRRVDGCGGETEALVLFPSGVISPYGVGQTYNTEQYFAFLEYFSRDLIAAFFNASLTDEDFEKQVAKFGKSIINYRQCMNVRDGIRDIRGK